MSLSPLVAVTGGTGFLGLHLVPALAQAGLRLRLLVRRPVTHVALEGLAFETVNGTLEDEAAMAALVQGADVVVHAAGLIKARDRAAFMRANRDGTVAVARAARRMAPMAKFIMISSLAAREPQLSNYAFSKRAAEDEVRRMFGGAAEQLAIIRPPAIYGPWDRETLAVFQESLWKVAPLLGHGKAAVIHARDAAGAIAAMVGPKFRPGCFALADENPEGYEIRALMTQAARATGGAPICIKLPRILVLSAGFLSERLRSGRGTRPIFTLGKAREMLHPDWSVSNSELLPREIYRPRISLTAGFAEAVAWYRQVGWLRQGGSG